jgi:hypothetical protein
VVIVPFVDNLGERSRSGGHKHLSNSILELFDSLIGYSQETLSSSFFSLIVSQIPNTVLQSELFVDVTNLGKDSKLEIL